MNYAAQISREGHLLNRPAPKGKAPRKRLPRVTKKRATELAEYRKRRVVFLKKHPYCQVWMKRTGVRRCDIDEDGCILDGGYMFVPLSKEIHHRAGRIGAKLNDESDWIAASREGHEWCHSNPSKARALGLLK